MKTLILAASTLLLVFSINAQMSLQDSLLLLNLNRNIKYMQYKPASVIEKRNPTYYGAAAVLFSTFLVNEAIIRNAENTGNFENTTRNAGTVYVVGVTLTIVICVLKSRKERRDKLYEDQRLLEDQQERWNVWNYHKQGFGN